MRESMEYCTLPVSQPGRYCLCSRASCLLCIEMVSRQNSSTYHLVYYNMKSLELRSKVRYLQNQNDYL